jgi:hypothetical protein
VGLEGGCGEEFEGAFGFEVFGNPSAEFGWLRVAGGFGFDLNHGFTVWSDYLGDHAPLVLVAVAVGSYGKLAASAEGVEGGALGFDGEAGVWVFEEGNGVAEVGVAGFVDGVFGAAGFERECALAGGGTHLCGREALVNPLGAFEAVEASCGEDEGVALALFELAQAGVDVAADLDEGDVGAKGEELGAAAGAGRADAASGGEGVERPEGLADPDVAGVGALRDRGEGELRGELGGEVFEAVDGEVDAALFEGFLDLLDEDALAIEVWRRDEAGLLHAVAGGADDFKFDVVASVAEGVEDVVGLPKGELRASAADADGVAGVVVLAAHVLSRIRDRMRDGSSQPFPGCFSRDGIGEIYHTLFDGGRARVGDAFLLPGALELAFGCV